jgi:hypothetical protein
MRLRTEVLGYLFRPLAREKPQGSIRYCRGSIDLVSGRPLRQVDMPRVLAQECVRRASGNSYFAISTDQPEHRMQAEENLTYG